MKNLINHLSQFLVPSRLQTLQKVLDQRTRYITVALEDIYQSQNASAVLRTCDCLGIQDIHIIENRNQFQIKPDVVLGSTKWLNIIRHNQEQDNTTSAIRDLRKAGYRIIATSPHKEDTDLDDMDLEGGKIALFFGTELKGLTSKTMDLADGYLKIPNVGFTESFNISVSAAIILYQLTSRLRQSGIQWPLEEEEKDELMLNWLRKSIKKCDMIEAAYYRQLEKQ